MDRWAYTDRVLAVLRRGRVTTREREAIRQEINGHIEDHMEALRALGYDEWEAEERTIAAMGDPEELGKELNQVHSPLLGWLWLLSRWAVRMLIVFLAAFIITDTGRAEDIAFWAAAQREATLAAPPWSQGGAKYFTLPDDGICVAEVTGEPVTVGAYTISVLQGELRRWRDL